MGSLRDKIFHHAINNALDRLRNELCLQYKLKKEHRFFTGGITYEISPCKLVPGGAQFEISSKIPAEVFIKKGVSEKYFKEVKKVMTSKKKRPANVKMENIIRSTNINERKERDYVKCTYFYKEDELFNDKEIEKILKLANDKKVELSQIKGANTNTGRAVIFSTMDNMYKGASANINDLIKANEETLKNYL